VYCGKSISNTSGDFVVALRYKMMVEFERRPIADTICLPEFHSKIPAGMVYCDICRKNAMGTRKLDMTQTLLQLTACIQRLPKTVDDVGLLFLFKLHQG
jgi:hypothetical protein